MPPRHRVVDDDVVLGRLAVPGLLHLDDAQMVDRPLEVPAKTQAKGGRERRRDDFRGIASREHAAGYADSERLARKFAVEDKPVDPSGLFRMLPVVAGEVVGFARPGMRIVFETQTAAAVADGEPGASIFSPLTDSSVLSSPDCPEPKLKSLIVTDDRNSKPNPSPPSAVTKLLRMAETGMSIRRRRFCPG